MTILVVWGTVANRCHRGAPPRLYAPGDRSAKRSATSRVVLRKNLRRTLERVVMVQTAKSLMGNDAPSRQDAVSRHVGAAPRVVWQSWTTCGMWPLSVVVRQPLGQHVAQVPFVQRNDPVEALASRGADEPFASRVRLRRPWWSAQNPERHGPERVVDRGREDGIAVVDDESIGRVERETIPELLDGPFSRGGAR
jgi:hypothetical protein